MISNPGRSNTPEMGQVQATSKATSEVRRESEPDSHFINGPVPDTWTGASDFRRSVPPSTRPCTTRWFRGPAPRRRS
jgi:hypothetical protein